MTAIVAYADDITLLITSPEEVPNLREILDQYMPGAGTRINIQKSKAMVVGVWDT
jgi:hypothetical protein